jgi:hypothetical protein
MAAIRCRALTKRYGSRTGPVHAVNGLDLEIQSGECFGLLGLNLMGGRMWGVGFVIADMRVKKLLKRLAATPMARADFLWSLAGSRLLFMLPEIAVIMATGVLLFGMPVRGSWLAILALSMLGAAAPAALSLKWFRWSEPR